jgi:hypothetical protein
MKILILFLSMLLPHTLWATDLPIKFSPELDERTKDILEDVLKEVSDLLPEKFKAGLPANIEFKIQKLSNHDVIPNTICSKVNKNDAKASTNKFVYGEYNRTKNLLIINTAVFNVLANGRRNSVDIECQHKTVFDQAIATLVHELAHAYDGNNQYVSRKSDFFKLADFKKSVFAVKSKNTKTQRFADPYELVNVAESYAVNFEYFVMDPEYACRRPGLFEYFELAFENNPYPNRNCTFNKSVMASGAEGFTPTKLDIKRIYRVDYLMASPGSDLSAGFGHSMFRIVVCAPKRYDSFTKKTIPATPFGPKCLEDKLFHLVVSYRANVEGVNLNHIKGVIGGYPSMLFILNFNDVLSEYNRDELRDVVSYPLKLSSQEKEKFINKVIEEHWSYRGSYKFFTNNCAVESFDLLKNSLDRPEVMKFSSVSPQGVLDDLIKLGLVSPKSEEWDNFEANLLPLQMAYKEAFKYQSSNDAKKDKKALLKFIDTSSSLARLVTFEEFVEAKTEAPNLHEELVLLKAHLVKSASFSVMEQQILRFKLFELKKKAVEYFVNSKDEKIQEMLTSGKTVLKQDFVGLAKEGYGVPLFEEMTTREDIDKAVQGSNQKIAELETIKNEVFKKELQKIELIEFNKKQFSAESIIIRKMFKEKLEIYIQRVLEDVATADGGSAYLESALKSKEVLNKVRDFLDKKLVDNKEVLDAKLKLYIEEALKN